MAGDKSITPSETERRGARAALEALGELEAIGKLEERSVDDFYAHRAQAVGVLRRHTESEFGEGFLTTVAEYIDECNWSSAPDLRRWKPTLLETKAHATKWRRTLEKTYAGDD